MHRIHRQNRVLMVRRADHHRVDILVCKQFAVVMVTLYTVVVLAGFSGIVAIHERVALFHAVGIEIADGHDARLVELPDTRQIVAAGDAAHSDRSYIDAIARSFLPEDA